MKEILKQALKVNRFGNVLANHWERVTDYEDGTIEHVEVTSLRECPACHRPLEKTEDTRSACVRCGRPMCVTCESHCAICHRPLCRHCRCGFPEKGLSVCSSCLPGLQRRLDRLDRLAEEKLAHEQLMAVYGSQMKLSEMCLKSGGSIPRLVGRAMQFHVAKKLARLEERIVREHCDGRRLLP